MALATVGCIVASYLLVRVAGDDNPEFAWTGRWLLTCLVFSGCAAVALLGSAPRSRTTAALVMLGTIGCQLAGFIVPPPTSTDAYHYVWDGRVSASGVSPYRYVPGDDALAGLRDPILFPDLGPTERSGITTRWPLPSDPTQIRQMTRNDPRTVLNRPAVPTVYPPVAQVWFLGVAVITPWQLGTTGVQLAAAVLAVGIGWWLIVLLRRLGADQRWALLWGWSPTVCLEATANGHVDVLAALFVVAACSVAMTGSTRSRAWAGALIGLAAAVKIFPVMLLATVVDVRARRCRDTGHLGCLRSELVPLAAAAGTLAVVYAPFAATAGARVFGFLSAYFVEEGYVGRNAEDPSYRFAVLAVAGVPPQHRLWVGLVLSAVVLLWVLSQADVQRPWVAGCQLVGWALLIGTPSYPWYALVFLPLIVLARRPEWLLVPIVSGTAYLVYPHREVGQIAWACGAVVVIGAVIGRAVQTRLADRGRPPVARLDGAQVQ
jgi:hypothetical protein